ncbi:MAG: hypothetical protein SPL62_07245 [Selenomonas sp.]|jgi:hypothetical protein|uniref:hypothetical protein n=1 Tax=uncultured Selenomonas sp. TaxID=159275 RepID=UPI0025D0C0CA|nr:hypothetical protein [uncultured Selenomonas sp.]MDD6127203.1 hypothetical protein [Veillonellaceae bacterium]MDD6697216.1 hypothetical protein [Veillonellaceae bacterium]MDY6350269.1 hypothetical protein [Selenomonas sp.]
MSTIDEIREQSKTVWAVNPLTQMKNDTSTDDEFSKLLEKMKTGNVSGGSGDSGSSDDTKTRTVTEVLSDGSVLVTVWEGNKIVSQTKTHAANAQENLTVLSVQSESGAANAKDAQAQMLAESYIGGTASAAALGLNALMQS